MPQTAALDPALLMYIRYVCTHAYVLSECTDRCVTPSALTVLSAKSDEETSDGLDGQDASRAPSVDGEAVPVGEQAPTQGRPPCRSAPDLSAVREGDLSDRLHQQDDRGLVCPPCKVHGELMGGLSCPMHCSESDVGLGCCGHGGVYTPMCVSLN